MKREGVDIVSSGNWWSFRTTTLKLIKKTHAFSNGFKSTFLKIIFS